MRLEIVSWVLVYVSFRFTFADDLERNDVAIVVSAIGGPDIDGEREDISWIPRNLTKEVHIYHYTRDITKKHYQRTKKTKLHFIGNVIGNDCLAYLKYIISNYDNLPKAVLFLRADADLKCPSIRSILETPHEDLSELIGDPRRSIPGYMSLTRVLLNQSEPYLTAFNYPMVDFANHLTLERCEYLRKLADLKGEEIDPCENFTLVETYPKYVTSFLSGTFSVARENILRYPLSFYKNLYNKIYHGQVNERTCGMLEYLWPVLWGGKPFETKPDYDRPCGSIYQADLASEYGFIFFYSEDGSLEQSSIIPRGYHGYILNPSKGLMPQGYKGFHGQSSQSRHRKVDRTEL